MKRRIWKTHLICPGDHAVALKQMMRHLGDNGDHLATRTVNCKPSLVKVLPSYTTLLAPVHSAFEPVRDSIRLLLREALDTSDSLQD